MDIFQFLTDTTGGKCLFTMLVSMVPIIELRGGLPFGVALGLPYYLAFPAAVLGNLIPAPFIIVYIRRIFELMRRYMPRLNGLVDKLEKKAHLKGQKVQKYQYLGLWIFVAIPLPGTGVDRLSGGRLFGDAVEESPARCGHGRADRRVYHAGSDPCRDQPILRHHVADGREGSEGNTSGPPSA